MRCKFTHYMDAKADPGFNLGGGGGGGAGKRAELSWMGRLYLYDNLYYIIYYYIYSLSTIFYSFSNLVQIMGLELDFCDSTPNSLPIGGLEYFVRIRAMYLVYYKVDTAIFFYFNYESIAWLSWWARH